MGCGGSKNEVIKTSSDITEEADNNNITKNKAVTQTKGIYFWSNYKLMINIYLSMLNDTIQKKSRQGLSLQYVVNKTYSKMMLSIHPYDHGKTNWLKLNIKTYTELEVKVFPNISIFTEEDTKEALFK